MLGKRVASTGNLHKTTKQALSVAVMSEPNQAWWDHWTSDLHNNSEISLGAKPSKAFRIFGALGMALHKSAVSCVKLFIQGGANVSGAGPCDNPLVTAAEKGLTEAIKCLLEAGAYPNVFDTFGRLPIELAAEYGTPEDVKILFPSTSPVSTVANWSVDGIISHVKMEIKQLEDV